MNDSNRVVITYICNICKQTRMTILPQALDVRVDERGLSEFVDVHQCVDSNVKANILFIDSHHNVRSQVSVSGEEEKKKPEVDSFLNIPMPTKTEMPTIPIRLDRRYKAKFVKEINIKDKLRQLIYASDTDNEDVYKIDTKSPMGFIEVTANISDKIDKEIACEWITLTASILEEVVHIDERTFTHLISYLDERIKNKPGDKEITELDFLLNSPISIPCSNQKSLDNFKKQSDKLFTNLAIIDYTYYKNILSECIDNDSKTLSDIIELFIRKISIAYFLSIFFNIVRTALLRLEKFQFFTISGSEISIEED